MKLFRKARNYTVVVDNVTEGEVVKFLRDYSSDRNITGWDANEVKTYTIKTKESKQYIDEMLTATFSGKYKVTMGKFISFVKR